jgi:hypothetical protein
MLTSGMLRAAGALAMFAGALAAAVPNCNLVPGWTPQDEPRSYTTENLYEYMDGNSEGYFLYGFQNMHGVTCVKGETTLVIDISEFNDADSAYGMFCANRDLRQPMAKIGMGGQIVPRRSIFTKGPYYVEIAANPEGDYTAVLQAWSAALEKTIEGATDPPAALRWFPENGQQSLRLVPESVLGIRLLRRGYVAEYERGKAFVVTEASDDAARALMTKLRARFGAGDGDAAFEVNDKYLGHVSVFRKGRFVGGAAGDAAAELARTVLARLP